MSSIELYRALLRSLQAVLKSANVLKYEKINVTSTSLHPRRTSLTENGIIRHPENVFSFPDLSGTGGNV